MKLRVWEGAKLLMDVSSVFDNDVGGPAYKGGRIGVYCDSQELITWSALSYRYISITNLIISEDSGFRCKETIDGGDLQKMPNSIIKRYEDSFKN